MEILLSLGAAWVAAAAAVTFGLAHAATQSEPTRPERTLHVV